MTVDVFSCIANGNPNDLRGCVDSYVQHAKLHGRDLRIIVVDNAMTASCRNASREALLSFYRRTKIDVEYTSARDIDVFLTRAAQYSWVDIDTLKYAVLGDCQMGSGYGSACNVARFIAGKSNALIASAGTRCEIALAPGGHVRPVMRPAHGKGFSDPLFADVEPVTFFGSPEKIGMLPQVPEEDLFGEVNVALAEHQVVSLGTWGDVGVDSPGFYLLSPQASEIANSDSSYSTNRLNRLVHRSAKSPTAGAVNLRLAAFGVSPSAQVPFLPTENVCGGFAGQSLFGLLIRIYGQSVATLPLAIRNVAAQAFSFSDIAEIPRKISLTDFLSVMTDSVVRPLGDAILEKLAIALRHRQLRAERLRRIGHVGNLAHDAPLFLHAHGGAGDVPDDLVLHVRHGRRELGALR